MHWRLSSPRPGSPLTVAVGLPDGAALHAWFVDDGSTRDLTEFIADLLVDGLAVGLESGNGVAEGQMPAAEITLSVDPTEVVALLLDPAGAQIAEIPTHSIMPLLVSGTRAAIEASAADHSS